MTTPAVLTEQQLADLAVARSLAATGVPIFVAVPDATSTTGFALPPAWQQTTPDPAVADRWAPGMALCAVMGQGLDLIDVDPRNGGEVGALNGSTPTSYGISATPSGGVHSFIASVGVGSRDGIAPGLDFKGGEPDGSGRGFAFLPPTVRPSKVTGEPAAYRWAQVPDPARLAARSADVSGQVLAARVRALRADAGVRKPGGPSWYQEFLASREPQSAPAAEKAIGEKLAEVAAWTPEQGAGFRHVLLRAAMTLGGYVGGGYLDEADAWGRLEQVVARVWGAADEDDRRWIEQGLTDGAQQPFHVYTAADELAYGEAAQAVAATRTAPSWSPYRALGTEPFDPQWCSYDQEFAEVVAARAAPVLRYAADAGSWLVREAASWREREDLSGWAVAIVARLMPLGSTPVPKDATERTDAHWQAVRRQRFMTSAGSGAIERKLRSILRGGDHPSAIELAGLDTEPDVLWAGGLPWDLRASGSEPTPAGLDPATPHLRTALCAPEARETPVWDRFVAAVWPDPEVRAWGLRVLSVALAGYPDAVLPVLYGPERTGKTSLISLMVKVLGSYAHAADPRLLSGADTTHASVVYALKGRRLSFIDEGPRRGHLAAERLKQLTGGGELTGNAMRSNPITFAPTHTLVMTTNDEPPISDPALKARVRVLPCEADPAAVRAARQALTAAVWEGEAPGVLAALMRETAAWLAAPDSTSPAAAPAVLRGLVEEMAAGQDPVREWAVACTIPFEEGTAGRELYTAFVRWLGDHPLYRRMSPPSETSFGRSLTAQGFPPFWGGPRGKNRFRPLTVMTGGPERSGWGPLMPTVRAEGLPTVADGSGGQPSAPQNPTSTPVFSSIADSADSSYRPISKEDTSLLHKGEYSTDIQGNAGREPNRRHIGAPNGPPPATMPVSETVGRPSATVGTAAASAPGGADTSGTTPDAGSSRAVAELEDRWQRERAARGEAAGAKRAEAEAGAEAEVAARAERNELNRDVARRAAEAKITKAEARNQLKVEQRLAAIAEAQGEVLALPAVVDRDGHVLPVTVDQAADVVRAALARSGALTVDVETSGYPVGHADYALRSVQLGDALGAVVLHPVEHAATIRALLAEAPRLHAHSATADLVPLAHASLIDAETAWERMHDTVIPAKLADPQSTGSDPGLKALAGAVLGSTSVAPAADAARSALWKAGRWLTSTKVDTPVERSGWAQVETGSTTMLRYAASDVLDTAALARALPAPDARVYERERTAQRMTARVAQHGIRIDVDHVRALTDTHTAAMAEVAQRVQAFGVANPGSDQQVAAVALQLGAQLPTTKTGRPSVAAGVLDPLKAAEGQLGEFVTAVLEYRHHETVLGLFLEPYRLLCERGDGRARPTIYTLGTDTGRMSATRPNIQQLSREGGVRAILTADPGQLMIGADFSGVEIRVAAALSQDPTLLAFLAEGRDLHGEIAKQVWGEGATKANRYVAKRGVFGRIYGGGIETLAMQVGVQREVMQTVIDTLDALTPQLTAWSTSIREAVKRGATQFPSYSGRVIHLPRDYPHKGPNYCIQGTARELLVDALVRWNETRWGSAVLLPVHDELDVFVPEADAEQATAELVRCMETELFGVSIVADPSTPAFAWQDSS